MDVITVMLCGVGGQGTILAADILAKVASAEGCDVKLSEVHGMSQRGGGVDTVVRFGGEVLSPITYPGGVDVLVAFDLLEAARQLHFLREGGTLLVNDALIPPIGALQGTHAVDPAIRERLLDAGAIIVDAASIARESGSARSTNIVLLGGASKALTFPLETWNMVIEGRVPPKTVEVNLKAFAAGREAVSREES